MTEEEKKAVEAENKDMKALSEEELEGVAGGRKPCITIGGSAPSLPADTIPEANGGAIYNQGSI